MSQPIHFPHIDALRALCLSSKRRKRLELYVVGGFIRDLYLNKNGCDVDFAVNSGALALAKDFAKVIQGAYVVLDESHGSARVVSHVVDKTWTYDFTDFRGADITEDLELRDFTINTFSQSVLTGEEYSVPSAKSDLKSKTIRMVSPKAFSDDPLRLMRAFSLSAQTGFKIHAQTLTVIKKQAHLIINPAMERVREEFFKILHSPRAHATLLKLESAKILVRVVPQLEIMFGVTQGGYHHLDVWKHSLQVLAELENLLIEFKKDSKIAAYLAEEIGGAHTREALLKFSALLHDIGKPETKKKEKDRMTFHSHEHVGASIVRHVAKHLRLTVRERYWLEDAVRWHLRPGYLSNFKEPSAKAIFRYLRDTKEEAVAIALLAIADQRSTCGPKTTKAKSRHHEAVCRMVIEEYYRDKTKPVKQKLISGHDLIKTLKLKPSPLFAEILTKVEEELALGHIKTKEEALVLARSINAKKSK